MPIANLVDKDTVFCMSLAARPGNHGNRFHNHLYGDLGLNWLYKSFTSSDIAATMAGVRSLGIRGVSVSMPYKESCMEFLDQLDPSARAIDSVNTIVNDDGVLTGYNTDFIAVRAMLAEHQVPSDSSFALLGSGGMAKAVLAALHDAGFDDGQVVAPFDIDRGLALADRYGVQAVTALGDRHPRFLLNATPVGMTGGPDASALAFERSAIENCESVFDVVYLPPDTPLVRLARSLGKRVLTGDEVMRRQSLEQFILYTGVTPTPEQIDAAEAYASAS